LKRHTYISLFLSFLFLSTLTVAQESTKTVGEDEKFKHVMTIGVNTNTNSALIGGFSFKYGRKINDKQTLIFGGELVNVKSHKEEKFSSISTGNSFIPGKINYLYSLRTQIGKEYLLFGAYPEDGIRLSAIFMGGITWGIVKPYYIEYDYSQDVGYPSYEIEAYDPTKHQLSRILGRGGFFHGFEGLNLSMGLNAKASLNFEFGKGDLLESVSGIEVGFNIEYFPKEVDIFAVENNQNVYTSLFLIFYIGSRY